MTLQNLDCKQTHGVHYSEPSSESTPHNVDLIEAKRLIEQAQLDASKSAMERNRLGQYATPNSLAIKILDYSKFLLPANEKIRFLDPAIGTGSFYSALLKSFPIDQIESAVGYEIDQNYAEIALQLWANTPLKLNIADFTEVSPSEKEELRFNLLICNPPYVRHHHLSLEKKKFLKELGIKAAGIQLSGLAGLYCYFLLAAHRWMSQDGLACWLIPSEFMDVNYGEQIKDYLLNQVTLIRVHRFAPDDLQFDGVLVSTSVIWFKNTKPNHGHFSVHFPAGDRRETATLVEFTSGGSISEPFFSKAVSSKSLRKIPKWNRTFISDAQKIQTCGMQAPALVPESNSGTGSAKSEVKLSDLFEIKRGVATGANNFFILTPEQISQLSIPSELVMPILPSPRYLPGDEVFADEQGIPSSQPKLFLLTCRLQPEELRISYPSVWEYLQQGIEAGIPNRYLCKHRSLWYLQETRYPTPFLCTYMGRYQSKNGKPFRFILNHSKAIAPNVYLMMYPKQNLATLLAVKPKLLKSVWKVLNSISMQSLIYEGRVYGDGLYKLEPRELANAPADILMEILENPSRVRT